jgi:putative heme-binding domain-containing protein
MLGHTNAALSNAPEPPVVPKKADPKNPNQIGNLSYADALKRASLAAGSPNLGAPLFKSASCDACHATAADQPPKGPVLANIGKRLRRTELIEAILKPNAQLTKGFESWSILTADGKVVAGFVLTENADMLRLRQANGLAAEIATADIEMRKKLDQSMMPSGFVDALTPEQLADLVAYIESLK